MNQQFALANVLKTRLEALRIRYPSYSLRAFAKKAGVSPATMSLIIQGKRPVSQKLATALSQRLGFDPQERSEVLETSLSKHSSTQAEAYIQLSIDQYKLISDWKAFAILSLIKTADFQNDIIWIARRLGISTLEVEETLSRLERLEMLKRKNGKLVRSVAKYRTTEDIQSLSLQHSHAQTLELAQRSLEVDDVSMRDFTWLTLPTDLSKMAKAKELIRKFQDDFSSMVESETKSTEVYRLAIQFFPLTKVSNPKKGSKNE